MARALKPIQSSALRFVGDLEQRDQGTDLAGSPLATYSLFAAGVRFDIQDWRATETLQANQVLSSVVTYVTIRWRPGIEGAIPGQLRLKHIADASVSPPVVDYYDIQGVVRDPTTRVALQLACIRRDGSGFRTGITP
jgi:hypothetical protein